jgi:hypothetical protein
MRHETDGEAPERTRRSRRRRHLLTATIAVEVLGTIVARLLGYPIGLNTPVRCRQGHLFTTIWIPGASVKSVRLGWWRIQHCPVGRHWTVVRPVRAGDLSDADVMAAREHRDVRLP